MTETTKRLKITELDQTIVDSDLAAYVAPNEFIRDLVAAAVESGKATRKDAEGCTVTATVLDA